MTTQTSVSPPKVGTSVLWEIPSGNASIRSATGSLTYENFLDGGDPLVVTQGELAHGPIEWSADGRWIYYRGLTDAAAPSGQPTLDLRRIPTDGGESELVESRVEWFDLGSER